MLDSGNGAQLMYRVDIPSDDEGMLQKCLQEVSKASTEAVKIDLTVHNPARIWRIPGTMNCKGDSIPARPHRMAKILDIPQDIQAVPIDKIQDIASTQVEDSIADSIGGNTPSGFDLDAWIRQYCPELDAPQDWKGGRK